MLLPQRHRVTEKERQRRTFAISLVSSLCDSVSLWLVFLSSGRCLFALFKLPVDLQLLCRQGLLTVALINLRQAVVRFRQIRLKPDGFAQCLDRGIVLLLLRIEHSELEIGSS